MSFFKRLKDKIAKQTDSVTGKFKEGLTKTRTNFQSRMNEMMAKYRKIDEGYFEELEELLISADVGLPTVMKLIEELKHEVKLRNISEPKDMQEVIVEKLVKIYQGENVGDPKLNIVPNDLTVILFVGVNGVGKTTTIGKLSHHLKSQGKKVLLAAGDTFRAGAISQLEVWGERTGVEVIKHEEGSDPAAVIYDAIQSAKAKQSEILLCDTAGRLQNKVNLMNELEKVKRVINREVSDGPHEVLLVLDATTGQNAFVQAKQFKEVTNVSGIVLTKLDGTAKGGIAFAIKNELDIPVKFIGLGEKLDDLQPFNAPDYVYGLFGDFIDKKENE